MGSKSVLLLDIGGVLFTPLWREKGIDQVSKELGIDPSLLKRALDENKVDFYTGKITKKEYWLMVCSYLALGKSVGNDLATLYRTYVSPVKEAVNMLPKLAKRYLLVAFNNSSREWMDYRVQMLSLDRYFTEFFTSGYTGFMKPGKESFRNVFKHFDDSVIIYADDNEQYLSLARDEYGIATKLIKSSEDIKILLL